MKKARHRIHKEVTARYLSQQEAIVFGKSLREKTPRASHAGWHASRDRVNPVDILRRAEEGRLPDLIPIRYGRMLQSPFTFFRGAASVMAADLASTPATGCYVQACGDCHLLNFGVFGSPERSLMFDINDFDETLPAPWEWDIKRLAASFIIAARSNGFSKRDAKDIASTCVKYYRNHTAQYAKMSPLDIWYSHITVEDILNMDISEKAKKRTRKRMEKAKTSIMDSDFPKLTEMKYGRAYIKDNPPLIYHRTDVGNVEEFHNLVEAAFEKYKDSLASTKRVLLDQYKFQDIARKVVGIGSVGSHCSVSLWMSANNDPLFLQVKEARPSVLEPYAGKSVFSNPAQRVVEGQKLMQAFSDIFLGFSELVEDKHYFYVRQLHDMKIKPLIELWDEDTMRNFAKLCGWALARAHARSGKAAIISGYLGNSSEFDDAITQFAVDYADQNEKDYKLLKKAVADGKIEVYIEE